MMKPLPRAWIALAVLVMVISGCLAADNPLRYPWAFQVGREGGGTMWAADLDGDGRDEWLTLNFPATRDPLGRAPAHALLFNNERNVFGQTNYSGAILAPEIMDVSGDSLPEVVVPVLRKDSLFLSVASGSGEELFDFLLTTGKPRTQPGGVLPWDPTLSGLWAVDLDGDQRKELVTSVTTWYAGEPRGIFVNSLPSGELTGKVLVGAAIRATLLGDFDGDGRPEVLVATQDTKNGFARGGFTDMQSYLILFDLTPKPRVAWSRTLTSGGGAALGWTDLNNDGTREVLLARTAGQLQIEIIDARTLQAVRHRDFAGAYFPPVLVDLDWDTHPEVVAASGTHDELVLVDDNLGSVRRLKPPFPLTRGSVWPDVDGDGVQELAFQIPGKGFALLDPELHVKAVFPRGSITGIQDRGPGLRPRIFIEAEGQALDATLQSNPWFLPIRYGPPGLAIALCIGGVFVITYAQRFRSRYRLMYAVGVESLEAKGRGLMVLDGRGSIRWRGPGLAWTSDRTERDVSSLSGLSAHEPELVAWCRQNMRVRPPRTRTGSISLRQTAGAEHADVSMTPVVIGSTHDPHWIVRIAGSGHASQEAWPMMAQRITHAVKNPLTHMLLTVQRLQAEYRERAPAVASRLDPYSERIQDGIGQLRRLTTSFLKLVDLAEPELEETDLASLVTDFGERFRAHLPPDIRLRVETAGEAPTARVDREQIEVALDNLVTNAVDALEAGGTITLTVALAPGVRLDGDSSARDYVQIEVMDVGKGIPTEARERLFEPGYSTSEDGSGLGLAIVKKIVTDHEGRISLDSDVGVGTVFTLLIPQTGPGQQREEGV